MRHRAGHEVARMRPGCDRRQRQRRQSRHEQLPVFPARLLPLPGPRIGRRDAPQLERRRPQPEAEHDARRLGRRMRPDVGADRGAGGRADRRHPARIALRGVLGRLIHRVGVAGGDERERIEGVDLRDRNCVGHAAQVSRHPVGERRPDAVAHLDVIAMDRDPALRVDFHRPSEAVRAGAVDLGDASDAGADEHAGLAPARLLLGPLPPDRMLFQLVQNLRRADRDGVRISRHGPAALLERIAPPEFDRVERQCRRRLVDQALPAPSSSAACRSRASSRRSRRANAARPW